MPALRRISGRCQLQQFGRNLGVNILKLRLALVKVVKRVYLEVGWQMVCGRVGGGAQVYGVCRVEQRFDFQRDLLPGTRPKSRDDD